MRELTRTHTYLHNWNTVTSAFWLKYPNEQQPHVQEVHTVAREIDDKNKIMNLTRLVCIDYHLPGWIEKIINFKLKGHAVEILHVDQGNKKLIMKGRNISFWNTFKVEEECVYEPDPQNKEHTLFTQKQRYTVSGFPTLDSLLENYCVNKGKETGMKGVSVLQGIIKKIENEYDEIKEKITHEIADIKNTVLHEVKDIEKKVMEEVNDVKNTVLKKMNSISKENDEPLAMPLKGNVEKGKIG
tara:strand:+ start:291 stop:1016 length:726 start_codon:yes stop_codon:yes gene_type:complete